MSESFARTAYADELLGPVIVRREIAVRDRPVVAKAVVRGCLEIEIRESVRHSTPVQGLASDDARADPQKRLAGIGRVRMLGIINVELLAELTGQRLHQLFLILPTARPESSIHQV